MSREDFITGSSSSTVFAMSTVILNHERCKYTSHHHTLARHNQTTHPKELSRAFFFATKKSASSTIRRCRMSVNCCAPCAHR